jgi:hypothetical protein
MLHTSQISLYVDAMIVESIIADPSIVKKAEAGDAVMSVLNKIKDFFTDKMKSSNTSSEDLINIISPTAIIALFSIFGSPWIGVLVALSTRLFKVNIDGILNTCYNKIKSLVSVDKKTNSAEIDSIVTDAVNSNYVPITVQDEPILLQQIKDMNSTNSNVTAQMRDARQVKLAMIAFNENNAEYFISMGAVNFSFLQNKVIKILIKLFGWIFKIGLGVAGFMIVGDMVYNFIGKSDKKDNGILSSFFSTKKIVAPPSYIPKQTKFKLNPSYTDTKYNTKEIWIENYSNNIGSIQNMVIDFANEVYLGLDNLDNIIKSTSTFKVVVDEIIDFNKTTEGSNMVFLPRIFNTKKQIVDAFIDDVAKKTE